jgi:predicted transposase YdaD
LNWRDFIRNPNPVASALMTRMHIEPEDRPRVKMECLRMLATLKLDKARSLLISAFMEDYLRLTAAEMVVYNRELEGVEPPEREEIMQLTNEWVERGKEEGLKLGKVEGRREIVERQLRKRFGLVPTEMSQRVEKLSSAQVDELSEALLDFATLDDAKHWLASHTD